MLKKLINFLRRLKKWWKEFKLIEEAYEERFVLMKYNLGVAKYKDIDGTIKNFLAQKENSGFILHGKSNMEQVVFFWKKPSEKVGVTEWMPIHEVTQRINKKHKKEVICNLHEGLEEEEYQILIKELPTII